MMQTQPLPMRIRWQKEHSTTTLIRRKTWSSSDIRSDRANSSQEKESMRITRDCVRYRNNYCEFPTVDAEIKSHVIQTCKSSRLRRRALTDAALTLQQLIDLGRSMEMSERHTKLIEGGPSDAVVDNTSVAQAAWIRQLEIYNTCTVG